MPAALIIIDVQKAIDDPRWGQRNNPAGEANIARLLSHWRRHGWPLFHVRHSSREPESTYRPGQPGHDFKPEAAPLPGEAVITKSTNSAMIGTDLPRFLVEAGCSTIAVAGVITNNSVEATVRNAGNLGLSVLLVEDACWTFGRNDWNGVYRTAEDVHALSLANLDGEYCKVMTTADVLRQE
jgi:nicotinamidase-related amidase